MLTLVLDTRERDLQKACTALSLPFVVEALAIGDVAIRSKETKRKVEDPTKGKEEEEKEEKEKEEEQQDEQEESLVLLLERKSVNDLLSSIKDGRYEEQSYRLVHASGLHPHNIVYIVEGTQSAFRAAITDKQTLHSAIVSLQQYKGFSVMRTGSLQETAEYLLFLCKKLEKEGLSRLCYTTSAKKGTEPEGKGQGQEEDKDKGKAYCSTMGEVRYGDVTKKVKKDNITPANAGAMLLSQLPGMSYATAVDVLQPYEGSLPAFLDAARHDPKTALTQVLPISKKRLRSNVVQGIKSLLLHID